MSARLPLKDIVFISEFAAFCRTKGDASYVASDAGICALAQFGYPGLDSFTCGHAGVPFRALRAACVPPHNYASLATRLESLLSDMKVEVDRGE